MSHECKCIERLIRNNQVYSDAFEVDSNVVSTGAGGWLTFRDLYPTPENPSYDPFLARVIQIRRREGQDSARQCP
jgi:hypothetical protein